MLPTLRPGDRLLIRYAAPIREGRLVVIRWPGRPIAVKRAARRLAGGWDVHSDNPAAGTDSRTVGAIPADDVMAVVICRLWPPGVRRTAPSVGWRDARRLRRIDRRR